ISAARGLLLSCVVAAAGSHDELAVSTSVRVDSDGSVSGDGLRRGGLVANGVLVADVAGYSAADRVYVVQRAGKEGKPSSTLGNGFQRTPRAPLSLVAQKSDRIDRGPIRRLEHSRCLFQRRPAGLGFAVGYDEYDFLL